MLALIATIFPTIAGWINLAVSAVQNYFAKEKAASDAEQTAEGEHASDGSQSVDDKTSDDAQNAALDAEEKKIDNPIPVTVTKGNP